MWDLMTIRWPPIQTLLATLLGILAIAVHGVAPYAVNSAGLGSETYLHRYEPVFYNKTDIVHQHRRIKREANGPDEGIRLQFYSHGRDFDLKLGIQKNLFHPNVIIENSDGPIKYDTGKALTGRVYDDPDSVVHGIVNADGTFDGYLSTRDGDQYYIEPKSTEASSPSIMYRPEDVRWDDRKKSTCASHELYLQTKKDGSLPRQNLTSIHAPLTGKKIRRKRWAIDAKKKTCMLYLQADHLFFERFGSEEACIDVMTKHIQRVNDIYKTTDFDNDGQAEDVQFMIKRIKVHTSNHTKDPAYRYKGEYQVIKFLELFSEGDYDSFCLAYMFTFRDFEGGTLGLAWTGDLKNAGGVCEKKGHFRGGLKSLNTGIITLLNYGKVVPPSVSYITLAHELAHNLGSPHDPEADKACVPGGEDGNYIMFARATAGDRKNNNKFSPCSLRSILPVLNIKARDIHGCFTEPHESICGNGVVDKGEECDCGWEEDCKESCCFPMQLRPLPNEPPCKLRPGKSCSPSQGPCCTGNCTLKFGNKCREDNGCRDAAFCDGTQPFCPHPISKPNKTVCNKEYVCFMGECTGSICLAYGMESCQCSPEPWESSSKYCELCCKLPGEGNPCMSSWQWNDPPYDVPDMYAKPGSPCKNYTGYCDAYQTCREIDPSGPLATLRKLLLADEGLALIADWIDNHWYAVLIFLTLLISLLIVTAKFCGKRAKARLRKLTVMHSNVEAIQIQRNYLEDTGHTVHPTAVRKKIPFRKKVRERRSKQRNRKAKERKSENATPGKTMSKTGSIWRKTRRGERSKIKQTDNNATTELPTLSPVSSAPASRGPMPLPTAPPQQLYPALPTTPLSPIPPVMTPTTVHDVASMSSSSRQSNVSLPGTTSNGMASGVPEITHEVNTAIVPHAKDQKRKYRKGHQGHRARSKDRAPKSTKLPSNSKKKQSKDKKSSSKSSLAPGLEPKTTESPKSQKPGSSSGKKNIQVVYSPPFSVKVQVVEAESKSSANGSKPAEKKKEKAEKSLQNGSGASPSKVKSSTSFLQRRHQKNHGKSIKNPSSELRVLISPYNDEGDISSPVTPGS